MPFRTVAAVGAFMSLGQFGLLYLSMNLGMPPGLAALVLQAQVVFTIVIAAFALREPPSRAQVAGVALGVAGLAVVALGTGGQVRSLALVLCLLAGLSWGIGNVVSRAARAPGGLALTVWSATVVPLPLLGLSLLVNGPAAVGPRAGAVRLARRPVHRFTRRGCARWSATRSSTGCCRATRPGTWCRGCCSPRWSPWAARGRCSGRRPGPPNWPARPCWWPGC